MFNYCISTSTSGLALQVVVPVTGTLNVVDQQGNTYYATTTCTGTQTQTTITVDNPNLDFALGLIFFLVGMIFIIWLFKGRH